MKPHPNKSDIVTINKMVAEGKDDPEIASAVGVKEEGIKPHADAARADGKKKTKAATTRKKSAAKESSEATDPLG